MRGVGGVRKSIHQRWLAKGLGLGLLCWGFKGVKKEIPTLFKSDQWHFHQDNAPVHNSILVTDYLTMMGINTVPQPPYSPDLAPCDYWLFPKLRGCLYETIEMKEAVNEGHWHAYTRILWWELPEDVGTVQQVHCSRKRLLRRGLEFHVCTINKSAHTKKSLETYRMHLVKYHCLMQDCFRIASCKYEDARKIIFQFLFRRMLPQIQVLQ